MNSSSLANSSYKWIEVIQLQMINIFNVKKKKKKVITASFVSYDTGNH